MLLMCTHSLFKKRRRLSPPQASLGDAKCAVFKERKNKTKQGAWFYRALAISVREQQAISNLLNSPHIFNLACTVLRSIARGDFVVLPRAGHGRK
jgi:hypothetical protein